MLISRINYRMFDQAGEEGGAGGGAPASEGEKPAEGGEGQEGGEKPAEGGGQPPAPQGLAESIQDAKLREWVEGKGWKDTESLAKSAYNLEQMKGAPAEELVRVPRDPNAEQVREVMSRLGLPETPDKYEMPEPPEGLQVDEDFQSFAREMFHEAGLTSHQAKALTERYNNHLAEQMKAQDEQAQAQFEEEHQALKKEWGNGYERQERLAQHAARDLGVEAEQIDKLEQVMGYAGVLKFFAGIGKKMGEDNFVSGESTEGGAFQGQMTPAEAKVAYARFLNDEGNRKALMDKQHPNHKMAMEERRRLYQIMHPEDN